MSCNQSAWLQILWPGPAAICSTTVGQSRRATARSSVSLRNTCRKPPWMRTLTCYCVGGRICGSLSRLCLAASYVCLLHPTHRHDPRPGGIRRLFRSLHCVIYPAAAYIRQSQRNGGMTEGRRWLFVYQYRYVCLFKSLAAV